MTPTPQTPPRILVVDDEPSIQTFAHHVLTQAGYDVVIASSGPEVLELVAAPERFDLFVVDVMMPQMRGDELARRLRQHDPDAKILYFTGYSDRLFAERGTLWENEAFVDKPVTVEGLLEAVSLLLFGRRDGLAK